MDVSVDWPHFERRAPRRAKIQSTLPVRKRLSADVGAWNKVERGWHPAERNPLWPIDPKIRAGETRTEQFDAKVPGTSRLTAS